MGGETKKKFAVPTLRSRSADSKQANSTLKKGIYSVVSKSLPNMGKKGEEKKEAKRKGSLSSRKKKKKKKKTDEENTKGDARTKALQRQWEEEDERRRRKDKERAQRQSRRTLWRHAAWLVVLVAYSLLGGLAFSAIEGVFAARKKGVGNHERTRLLAQYERDMDVYRRRRSIQGRIFLRFREIDRDVARYDASVDVAQWKLEQMRIALSWYETKLGVRLLPPVMEDTKWTLWGGIYYSASLYTTIGYGDFHPATVAGQVLSMLYAAVFTILLDWGFLYFTWIETAWNWTRASLCDSRLKTSLEKRRQQERFIILKPSFSTVAMLNRREKMRALGSELSLHSSSTVPLLVVNHRDALNQTDHQMEANKPLKAPDVNLSPHEQKPTVPLKAAVVLFVSWLCLSACVVRAWEAKWSYFRAFYFFFTSLTTIGLGDVTATPNYIIFNLALTLVGLSVVGLCIAIVQAKVRLVFERMIRSIDAQYRIRQVDAELATMSVVPDEKEGVQRLIEAQSLQDRLVFVAMDEHKLWMLEQRWRARSQMVNRLVQTVPQRADKFVQTGNRVYDQPSGVEGDPDWAGSEWASSSGSDEEEESDEEEDAEWDAAGNRVVPPSTKRYIYTVFD